MSNLFVRGKRVLKSQDNLTQINGRKSPFNLEPHDICNDLNFRIVEYTFK